MPYSLLAYQDLSFFLLFDVVLIAFLAAYGSKHFVKYVYPHIKWIEDSHRQMAIIFAISAGFFFASVSEKWLSFNEGSAYRTYMLVAAMFCVALYYNKSILFRLVYLIPLYYGLHEFIYMVVANIRYDSIPFIGILLMPYNPLVVIETWWQPVSVIMILVYRKKIIPQSFQNLSKIAWVALAAYLAIWFSAGLTSDVPPFVSPGQVINVSVIGNIWTLGWTGLFTLAFFFTFCRSERNIATTLKLMANA
jgi:hypothetical protein